MPTTSNHSGPKGHHFRKNFPQHASPALTAYTWPQPRTPEMSTSEDPLETPSWESLLQSQAFRICNLSWQESRRQPSTAPEAPSIMPATRNDHAHELSKRSKPQQPPVDRPHSMGEALRTQATLAHSQAEQLRTPAVARARCDLARREAGGVVSAAAFGSRGAHTFGQD